MEKLEEKIKKFLAVDVGSGSNSTKGYGDGSGSGSSFDSVNGYGCGYHSGYGYYSGCGLGSGGGYSDGSGDGSSDGYGIKEVNGNMIYIIDNTPTIITSVRANVAQGFILRPNLQTIPCYIVKENDQFAHGDTLKDAFMSLQEKLYDDSTEEERIEAFKKKFPKYDDKYSNRDLFAYHHVLTGSCRMGRETFVADKGLSLDGETSIREFVELTKDSYGGKIIKKLPVVYGME